MVTKNGVLDYSCTRQIVTNTFTVTNSGFIRLVCPAITAISTDVWRVQGAYLVPPYTAGTDTAHPSGDFQSLPYSFASGDEDDIYFAFDVGSAPSAAADPIDYASLERYFGSIDLDDATFGLTGTDVLHLTLCGGAYSAIEC